MAQLSSGRSTSGKQAKSLDAIALLKQDHREIEELFDEFESLEAGEGEDIAHRICLLLTVHAQVEEELLYPAALEALAEDPEQLELVREAEVEHGSAKELIATIEEMGADDESFSATVKVLGEYVRHHVKEEEGELFPALRDSELDLKSLGQELLTRRQELLDEMGIEVAPPAAEPKKRRKKAKRSRH